MRRPPGAGDEAVRRADLERGGLAPERDLELGEHVTQPFVRGHAPAPITRQRPDGVDGHDPYPPPLLGKPPGEAELGDIAAEEMLEINRRDQQIDPPRRALGDRPAQRRDLVGDRGHVRGQPARAGLLDQGRRRQRIEAQPRLGPVTGGQIDEPPPRERVQQHPFGAQRLGRSEQLARAARAERRQLRQ